MADVVFLAVVVAFFGVALLVVRACERLTRGETAVSPEEPEVRS